MKLDGVIYGMNMYGKEKCLRIEFWNIMIFRDERKRRNSKGDENGRFVKIR